MVVIVVVVPCSLVFDASFRVGIQGFYGGTFRMCGLLLVFLDTYQNLWDENVFRGRKSIVPESSCTECQLKGNLTRIRTHKGSGCLSRRTGNTFCPSVLES